MFDRNDNRKNGHETHLIVGVGASGGGLDAFRSLLAALPERTGMTFLLVQHLDPHHRSLLAELLQPHTRLNVVEAQPGLPLAVDTIYVIQPNTVLGVDGDRLDVSDAPAPGPRFPVDHLFRSLARNIGDRAVGIVLSGAGSDGSAGVRDLKTVGGMTIAQAPHTCQQPGMPESAIDAGYVDVVLPVEEMPQALRRFSMLPTLHRVEAVAAGRAGNGKTAAAEATQELTARQLEDLSGMLDDTAGFDIRMYKPGTIARRVTRRRVLGGLDSIDDYLRHLATSIDERHALVRDLLISVTDFFRDADAFDALEELVVDPVVRQAEGDSLRCWVAGCATGEEAYSVAMLMLDHLRASESRLRLQVFATDLDEDALAIARAGIYPGEIAGRMSPERLRDYFTPLDDGSFRVKPRLRDSVSFSVHDLTSDPPFSHMSLVSCRNVLIYLRGDAQKQLLRAFQFALHPDGYLFLGPSETLGGQKPHFAELSKKWRIYRKTSSPDSQRAFPEPQKRRLRAQGALVAKPTPAPVFADGDAGFTRLLLDRRVPPSVVVAESGEIVYMHGDLRPFLHFPRGNRLALDLSQLLSREIATRAKAALYKARSSGETVVAVSTPYADATRIRITASPANEVAEGAVLVTFDRETEKPLTDPSGAVPEAIPAVVEELERELQATRDDLRHTVEELESTNEELRSSHEETVSMNEELQSSNEELEATSEELRSLNEELTTVNIQLREKIELVERAHDDLSNFFASTRIATVFLDEDLCLKRFTPAAAQLLDLGPGDIGTRLANISRPLLQHELVSQAETVLDKLMPMSSEIPSQYGAVLRRELQPYRTENRRIAGVVVTFIDISELKKADALRRRLAAIVESSDDAIVSKSLDGIVESWNSGAERLFGYTAAEMVGQPINRLEPAHRHGEMAGILAELRARRHIDHFETQRVAKDGRLIEVSLSVSPIIDAENRVIGAAKVARDITARKRADEALRESEARFRALIETQTEMLCRFRTDGTILFVNEAYARAQNRTVEEMSGSDFWQFIPADERPRVQRMLARITPESPVIRIENRLDTAQGTLWTLWTNKGLEFDAQGKLLEAQSTGIDITERKKMEERLRENDERKNQFLATLGHELRNPLAPLRTGLELLKYNAKSGDIDEIRDMLDRQVQHLTRLVDDLVDIARISRGHVELRRTAVSLNSVIDAAIELSQPLIESRHHELVRSSPEDDLVILGDFERLTQVVSNLLNNAASYTEDNGTIRIRTASRDGYATISVSDNGLGFPPSVAESLFDMYARIPQHRKFSSSGLGVGLPLARQLVELHGGTIVGRSDGPGKGSTFDLQLPLGDTGEAMAATPAGKPESRPNPDVSPGTRRILVVDDNHDAAESLSLLLQTRNHEVHVVHTGEDALQAVSTFKPEVVLLDIGLPDTDGYAVAERIRARPDGACIRLIALTGWGQQHDKRRAESAGFDSHLTKPADFSKLLELVGGE